ncbi:hypothetical protein [Chondromyces apiculatus]|uniref:Uncharacterized protein n=1 Tax=Chondromyces apiculatus DSM 436 TaxID=1192034 RepID=A0A017T0T9_9BACT|nr:hypothetical protein [Chondromyces apiculatus]EYF02874.1 Hypothetical protein CAP_6454 [Chondromyces apiculatus DSM 436]
MYYLLGCFGPLDEERARIGGVLNTPISWQRGHRFEDPPPEPVQVDLDGEYPGVLVPMFDAGILLFSDQMVLAFRDAGVNNLDHYHTVVRDPSTNTSHSNYKATNIVGVVSCADLSQSSWEAPSGSPLIDTDFESLSIDEERSLDLLMFRLAECITGIVIHERVKRALERRAIPHLNFYDPVAWLG